jgi:hypothetical protein
VPSTHHNRVEQLTFSYSTVWDCFFDGDFNNIPNTSIASFRTAEYLNALNPASTTVVRYIQHCLNLNHLLCLDTLTDQEPLQGAKIYSSTMVGIPQ